MYLSLVSLDVISVRVKDNARHVMVEVYCLGLEICIVNLMCMCRNRVSLCACVSGRVQLKVKCEWVVVNTATWGSLRKTRR